MDELIKQLDSKIESLEIVLKSADEDWRSMEEAHEDGSFDGSESWFGNSDDCFEAGTEYGQYLAKYTLLSELKAIVESLRKDNT